MSAYPSAVYPPMYRPDFEAAQAAAVVYCNRRLAGGATIEPCMLSVRIDEHGAARFVPYKLGDSLSDIGYEEAMEVAEDLGASLNGLGADLSVFLHRPPPTSLSADIPGLMGEGESSVVGIYINSREHAMSSLNPVHGDGVAAQVTPAPLMGECDLAAAPEQTTRSRNRP